MLRSSLANPLAKLPTLSLPDTGLPRCLSLGPNPLKIFVDGVSRHNGINARLAAQHSPQYFNLTPSNAVTQLFSTMDLVSFAGIIMSLLAIVFGYSTICGEKERGTLGDGNRSYDNGDNTHFCDRCKENRPLDEWKPLMGPDKCVWFEHLPCLFKERVPNKV